MEHFDELMSLKWKYFAFELCCFRRVPTLPTPKHKSWHSFCPHCCCLNPSVPTPFQHKVSPLLVTPFGWTLCTEGRWWILSSVSYSISRVGVSSGPVWPQEGLSQRPVTPALTQRNWAVIIPLLSHPIQIETRRLKLDRPVSPSHWVWLTW